MSNWALKELERFVSEKRIIRKTSMTQTEECPVWNSFDHCYAESDAQLRHRIFVLMGGKETENRIKKENI